MARLVTAVARRRLAAASIAPGAGPHPDAGRVLAASWRPSWVASLHDVGLEAPHRLELAVGPLPSGERGG